MSQRNVVTVQEPSPSSRSENIRRAPNFSSGNFHFNVSSGKCPQEMFKEKGLESFRCQSTTILALQEVSEVLKYMACCTDFRHDCLYDT